ncbi:MAG: hypothetical protein P8Y63_08730 [Deltaproteobacteria bacterium]|jgi:hypothetical protein
MEKDGLPLEDGDMSEKYIEKKMGKGVDPSKIVLDDTGRFELNEEQLAWVSGGMRSAKDDDCIEVIRGTKCEKECSE